MDRLRHSLWLQLNNFMSYPHNAPGTFQVQVIPVSPITLQDFS